jgi:hypothetical protein
MGQRAFVGLESFERPRRLNFRVGPREENDVARMPRGHRVNVPRKSGGPRIGGDRSRGPDC